MNAIAVVILSLSVVMGDPLPQGASDVGFEVHHYQAIKGGMMERMSVGLDMELNVGIVNGSSAMYIHDYNLNLEAIVPACGSVCLVRPHPDVSPKAEDIMMMESLIAENALIIDNEDHDIVEFVECGDQIIDTTILGDTIHNFCADRPTFLLEDIVSGMKKTLRAAPHLTQLTRCGFACGSCNNNEPRTPNDLKKTFARRYTNVICNKF